MKTKSLLYYKIGLAAVAVFVVVLFVLVLSQASGTKQDIKTFNAANNIATALNNYTDTHNVAPENLASAKIKNVPNTITYLKLSKYSYKFCVTYKSSSSNFDPNSITNNLLTSSNGSSTTSGTDISGGSSATDLYLVGNHHKGINCQTVKLYTFNTPSVTGTATNSLTSSTTSTTGGAIPL